MRTSWTWWLWWQQGRPPQTHTLWTPSQWPGRGRTPQYCIRCHRRGRVPLRVRNRPCSPLWRKAWGEDWGWHKKLPTWGMEALVLATKWGNWLVMVAPVRDPPASFEQMWTVQTWLWSLHSAQSFAPPCHHAVHAGPHWGCGFPWHHICQRCCKPQGRCIQDTLFPEAGLQRHDPQNLWKRIMKFVNTHRSDIVAIFMPAHTWMFFPPHTSKEVGHLIHHIHYLTELVAVRRSLVGISFTFT